jgi:hypothetical protein
MVGILKMKINENNTFQILLLTQTIHKRIFGKTTSKHGQSKKDTTQPIAKP